MKKIIYLLIFVLNSYCFQAQEIKNSAVITYNVTCSTPFIKKDTIIKKGETTVSKETINQANMILLTAKDVKATLKFNSKESLYQVDWNLNDEIGNSNFTRVFAGGNNKYYYNIDNHEFLIQSSLLGKSHIISHKPLMWKILDEKKQIGKYHCTKAVAKRTETSKKISFYAWFCPDIPVPFGPLEFRNLPGLVVEGKFLHVTFNLEKIDWNESEIDIKKPIDGEQISFKEYQKLINNSW